MIGYYWYAERELLYVLRPAGFDPGRLEAEACNLVLVHLLVAAIVQVMRKRKL